MNVPVFAGPMIITEYDDAWEDVRHHEEGVFLLCCRILGEREALLWYAPGSLDGDAYYQPWVDIVAPDDVFTLEAVFASEYARDIERIRSVFQSVSIKWRVVCECSY